MDLIHIIVTPLTGGLIGYITNALAIRMLFRPYGAIRIKGFQLPFTPGLIPAQQGRIASSIAQVVTGELLGKEAMRKSLVSEKTMGEIRGILITRISSLKNNERSVREVLEEFIEADEIRRKEDALSRRGANYLKGRLIESGIGERIADMATEEMRSKAESGLFSKGLFSSIASNAVNAVKNSIAEMVTRLVEEKSEEMIEDEIFGLEESLLDARICDIYERLQGHIPFFVDGIMNIYVEAVDSHLDEMLKAVDMESLIREKICGLSPAELERLVFDLMRKELNAIVYLGAFLGAVIGLINLLI